MSGSTLSPAVSAVIIAQQDRLEKAKQIYADIGAIERFMMDYRQRLFECAWHLGKLLVEMKEDVGHGRWLQFLAGQWPALKERDAQRCMLFFKENPRNSTDLTFTTDSIRKFMWGYIPEKERPELEGDEKVPPANHHLTLVNGFAKFVRQIKVGVAARAPLDQMRRDFEPMVRQQAELLGREWLLRILETLPAE